MIQGAATIGCNHICPAWNGDTPHLGGAVQTGSANMFVNGKSICRTGDLLQCQSPAPDAALSGSVSVYVNGLPACRMGDPTSHGGMITQGSTNVFIG